MMSRFFTSALSLPVVFSLSLGSALMVVSETHQTAVVFLQLPPLTFECLQLRKKKSCLSIQRLVRRTA